ncbi:hypothetical protein E4U15_007342, partial [Claviceps sp. LM218 group G6]
MSVTPGFINVNELRCYVVAFSIRALTLNAFLEQVRQLATAGVQAADTKAHRPSFRTVWFRENMIWVQTF